MWNGSLGDPTRTALLSWPDGLDLLPIYGGWLHTFVGAGLVRLGLEAPAAYTLTVSMWAVVAGLAGMVLARSVGASVPAAAVAGLVLQLDGFVLRNLTGGRPEHAGLGFTALALAAAWTLWKRPLGRVNTLLTAILGALVFVVSWEHALWLALALGWMLPWLWTGTADEDRRPALRRWGTAGLLSAGIASVWLVPFLVRALAVRDVSEGRQMGHLALDQAISLGDWALQSGGHPARGLVLFVLALPWLVAPNRRRVAIGAVVGLLVALVLAMGPSPGIWRSGDLWSSADGSPVWFGPFAHLQQLPVLGWFHSPERLAMGTGLAIAAAVALAVDRLAGHSRVGAALLGGLVVLHAGLDARRAKLWPSAHLELPPFEEVERLSWHREQGAVLDLPPTADPQAQLQRVALQLLHQRPIAGHLYLPHLAVDQTPRLLADVPLLQWAAGVPERLGQPPPPLADSDRDALRALGVSFVAIHRREVDPRRRQAVLAALEAAFGKPVAHQKGAWTAFLVR